MFTCVYCFVCVWASVFCWVFSFVAFGGFSLVDNPCVFCGHFWLRIVGLLLVGLFLVFWVYIVVGFAGCLEVFVGRGCFATGSWWVD